MEPEGCELVDEGAQDSNLPGGTQRLISLAIGLGAQGQLRVRASNRLVSRLATSRSTSRPSHSAWLRSAAASCTCSSAKGERGPWPQWGRVSPVNAIPSSRRAFR